MSKERIELLPKISTGGNVPAATAANQVIEIDLLDTISTQLVDQATATKQQELKDVVGDKQDLGGDPASLMEFIKEQTTVQSDTAQDIQAIDGKLGTLTNIEDAINAGNVQLEAVNTKLADIKDGVDTANTNLLDLGTKIDATNTKLDTTNSTLSSVDEHLGNLESKVDATNTKLDAVNLNLEDQTLALGDVNASLSSLDTKADAQATAAKQDDQTTLLEEIAAVTSIPVHGAPTTVINTTLPADVVTYSTPAVLDLQGYNSVALVAKITNAVGVTVTSYNVVAKLEWSPDNTNWFDTTLAGEANESNETFVQAVFGSTNLLNLATATSTPFRIQAQARYLRISFRRNGSDSLQAYDLLGIVQPIAANSKDFITLGETDRQLLVDLVAGITRTTNSKTFVSKTVTLASTPERATLANTPYRVLTIIAASTNTGLVTIGDGTNFYLELQPGDIVEDRPGEQQNYNLYDIYVKVANNGETCNFIYS